MNEYEKQANDFLESTGTTLTIEYLYTGPYFMDDKKDKRDVYEFTLKNARGEYSAKFGDSIRNYQRRVFANTCRLNGTRGRIREARTLGFKVYVNSDRLNINELKAALVHKPSAHDILSCLGFYYPPTFEDFCSELGYNDLPICEYPKIMVIYQTCIEEQRRLSKIFTEEQLEQLMEIQ